MNGLIMRLLIIWKAFTNRNVLIITYRLNPSKANVTINTKYKLHTDIISLKAAVRYLETLDK